MVITNFQDLAKYGVNVEKSNHGNYKGRCLICQEQIKQKEIEIILSHDINNNPIKSHDYCFERYGDQVKTYLDF